MGKEARQRDLPSNSARVKLQTIRVSPQKLGLIASAIRGKAVERALNDLTFMKRRIADTVKKALKSAVANAENNHQLDIDKLFISEVHVGKGMVMKRWKPRARGRSARIMKPFSHLTIVVTEKVTEES